MVDPGSAKSQPSSLLQRGLAACEHVLRAIVAVELACLMFLTFADVVGREILTAPVRAAFEITEIAMGILIFSAMPLLFAREQHVTVDLLDRLYTGRMRQARAILVNLFGAVVVGAMAWRLYDQAVRYEEIGDMTMLLSLPMAPIVSTLFGLAAVATVALLGRAAYHVIDPRLSGARSAPRA